MNGVRYLRIVACLLMGGGVATLVGSYYWNEPVWLQVTGAGGFCAGMILILLAVAWRASQHHG